MSASLANQINGLRTIARTVSPRHLMRSGAVSRESEAIHLLDMIKDAADTLEQLERGYFDAYD
jgi:hypothetical protein